jgi:hypothetical protein
LYTLDELAEVSQQSGLDVLATYGNLLGIAFDQRVSPKMVVLARKA